MDNTKVAPIPNMGMGEPQVQFKVVITVNTDRRLLVEGPDDINLVLSLLLDAAGMVNKERMAGLQKEGVGKIIIPKMRLQG